MALQWNGPVAQAEGRLEKLEEKLQAKRDAIQELQDAWRVRITLLGTNISQPKALLSR